MEGRQRPRLTFCSLVGDKETNEMVSLLELILQLITGNDNLCLEVWHWCSCAVCLKKLLGSSGGKRGCKLDHRD